MNNGNQQEAVQQDTSYDMGNVIYIVQPHFVETGETAMDKIERLLREEAQVVR